MCVQGQAHRDTRAHTYVHVPVCLCIIYTCMCVHVYICVCFVCLSVYVTCHNFLKTNSPALTGWPGSTSLVPHRQFSPSQRSCNWWGSGRVPTAALALEPAKLVPAGLQDGECWGNRLVL